MSDIWDKVSSDTEDNFSFDKYDAFAKALTSYPKFKSMSPGDLANLLESAGLNGDEIKHALSKMDIADDIIDGLFDVSGEKLKAPEKLSEKITNIVDGIKIKLGDLGSSFSGLAAKVGSFAMANKAALAVLAVTAVTVGVSAYIAYANSFENLSNKVEEAKVALSETASELSSMESEFKNNKTRIEELESIDAPTLADSDEIEKLQRANSLLSAQIELKKELHRYQLEETADAAYDALASDQHGSGTILDWYKHNQETLRCFSLIIKTPFLCIM